VSKSDVSGHPGRRAVLAGASAMLLAACDRRQPSAPSTPAASSAAPTTPAATAPAATPSPSPTPIPGGGGDPRVETTLLTDLHTPWGLAFMPDGSALLGSRDRGTVLHVAPDGSTSDAGTVPGVTGTVGNGGEGGLLGFAVSPTFETDHAVFCYLTTDSDNRVLRATYAGGRLDGFREIVTGIPSGRVHNGGGLLVHGGALYIGTGESGHPELAQRRSSLGGKVLRVDFDGNPAAGNPFDDRVFSFGHRNIEALAVQADQVWAVEFGQDRLDELNAIKAGANYGWPDYEGPANKPDFVDPARTWATDDCGPAGIAFSGDVAYIAALTGNRVFRVPIDGTSAGEPEVFLDKAYGRLRRITLAPDGKLWLTTSNTDGRGSVRDGDDRVLVLSLQ
jgi:aldose sugar dehydrogenase